MDAKRRRPSDESEHHQARRKRRAHSLETQVPDTSTHDALSRLPNELIIRILSYLTERQLLLVTPTCRRFRSLASDSQLWRVHYYRRFILPRAHRIPGFKSAAASAPAHSARNESKLCYSTQRSIWADGGSGRRGGLVPGKGTRGTAAGFRDEGVDLANTVDWKREYKLQHNWSQGECRLGEFQVNDASSKSIPSELPSSESVGPTDTPPETPRRTGRMTMPPFGSSKTLVKVVDGTAITVDPVWGLRSWDLRTRNLTAEIRLEGDGLAAQPSALSIDTQRLSEGYLDIAIGLEDGSLGIWTLDLPSSEFSLRLRQAERRAAKVSAVAYRYPYLFTATPKGLITLYSLAINAGAETDERSSSATTPSQNGGSSSASDSTQRLQPPTVLTSLRSQSTKEPLALSIRQAGSSTIASIAYTFDSWSGWCIGIQDFDVRATEGSSRPQVVTSRVAYTVPTHSRMPSSSPSHARDSVSPDLVAEPHEDGPTRLSYSHPYLLATLPDNTLALHVCTATATSLTISPPLRLWGHTSGISDAEVTPRGKAVSVSTHGDELRVWQLEGRLGGGQQAQPAAGGSVEVRPRRGSVHAVPGGEPRVFDRVLDGREQARREWVGFDDERVIVLKNRVDGKESLMIYDFA